MRIIHAYNVIGNSSIDAIVIANEIAETANEYIEKYSDIGVRTKFTFSNMNEYVDNIGVEYINNGNSKSVNFIFFNDKGIVKLDNEPMRMPILADSSIALSPYISKYQNGEIFGGIAIRQECNNREYSIMTESVIGGYDKYLKTEHWKVVRAEKLKQSSYKCQLCGDNKKELHVHHNSYENIGNEDINDLVVLCKDCHSKFHGK